MEVLLWAVGAAVGVAVAIVLIGTLVGRSLPQGHVASRTTTFHRAPDEVWAAINDPTIMRARGVGDVKMEVVESVPQRRLVRRIVGEKDFGGTWTCEIVPTSSGTVLTITENGEVYNPFFRFVSRHVVGHHRTMDGVIHHLHRLFGEA